MCVIDKTSLINVKTMSHKARFSQSLPVSFRREMNKFTFMETTLQNSLTFSKKKIREYLNRLFIHEVTYKRKLIQHWMVLV